MKLGAARARAPTAWRLVDIAMGKESASFTYTLNRQKLRGIRRREGRCAPTIRVVLRASRPGELHPGPLSEPYVRLSPHTAPIRRTRPQARPRFAAHTASSCCQLSGDAATRSNPFAPVPLQNLHRYYGSVRPSPLLRYSRLAVFAACASPLASEAWFLQFRAKACVRLTPPLRRSPSAQSSGSRRTCPRRLSRPWFRRHLSS